MHESTNIHMTLGIEPGEDKDKPYVAQRKKNLLKVRIYDVCPNLKLRYLLLSYCSVAW